MPEKFRPNIGMIFLEKPLPSIYWSTRTFDNIIECPFTVFRETYFFFLSLLTDGKLSNSLSTSLPAYCSVLGLAIALLIRKIDESTIFEINVCFY